MTLVERIVRHMDTEEVLDVLGLDIAIVVDALLEEILDQRDAFEEYLEDIDEAG